MRIRHSIVPLLCLSLVACGEEPNILEGSASAYYDLTFDDVSVASDGSALSVIYQRSATGEVVLRLTLETAGLDLRDAATVAGHTFKERITIERITIDDDRFSDVDGGQIYFAKFSLDPGKMVEGEFEMVFEGGLTLSGRFLSDVVDRDDYTRPRNPNGEPLSG